MVKNIKFKILPEGEGKTKWLVEKGFNAATEGKCVYLLTDNIKEYEKFNIHYRYEAAMYCPVKIAFSVSDISEGSVVLIDNIIDKANMNIDWNKLKNCADDVFVTASGIVVN